MNRIIKFRAYLPVGDWEEDGVSKYEMVNPDALAFEEYEPLADLLKNCENLMQFTGLSDNKRQEIFEGDIVKVTGADFYSNDSFSIEPEDKEEWEYIGVVKQNSMMWLLENTKDHTWLPMCDMLNEDLGAEVIGNIHENPELIKEKK